MFERCRNSKKKGDVGLAMAIAHFTRCGHTVLLPLTDSQDYDLAIDMDGRLQRVQVKATTQRNQSGRTTVGLRLLGGNTRTNIVHKHGHQLDYDLLFVVNEIGEQYVIPKSVIANHRNSVVLDEKYKQYRVA